MNRKRDIVLAIILTLFIISLAVCITVFCKQLYYFDIGYLDLVEKTGLSYDVIQENYDILIQYQSIFFQGALNLPHFPMSITGRVHFEEVKVIFESIQVLCLITGCVSAVMIYQNMKQKEYRYLKLTAMLSVGLPLLIGFFVSIDFDKAFVLFHKIVFRNDFWIFDVATDPVITILPERYFMHCFIMIIVIIVLISAGLYLLYKKKENFILQKRLED